MPEFQIAPDSTVIGIDFGSQKLGLAVGQTITGTATPIGLFPVNDGIPDWDQLLAKLAAWRPQYIVIGLPLNMDDTESLMSLRARKFARRLAHRTAYTVSMLDERLTTREARARLKPDQARQADAEAACILVENWLHQPVLLAP